VGRRFGHGSPAFAVGIVMISAYAALAVVLVASGLLFTQVVHGGLGHWDDYVSWFLPVLGLRSGEPLFHRFPRFRCAPGSTVPRAQSASSTRLGLKRSSMVAVDGSHA
jgi:hypothetical protein